jgi:hypothetical protein
LKGYRTKTENSTQAALKISKNIKIVRLEELQEPHREVLSQSLRYLSPKDISN